MLLRPTFAAVTRTAAIRITALVVGSHDRGARRRALACHGRFLDGTGSGREYYRQIAPEVTNNWHLAMGLPLRIVMGDPGSRRRSHSTARIIRTACRISIWPRRPGSRPERLDNEGWVAICKADDQPCTEEARRRAGSRNDVQFVNFSTVSRYLSRTGKFGRFLFVLVPPSRVRIVPQ